VIEEHLEILQKNSIVAFGKVKSKLNDINHPNEEKLEHIYKGVSKENPLQLFLTDYNSIYVANVISVTPQKTNLVKAPKYYDDLDVEMWYVFDDLRLIIHNNFELVRDKVLANFIAVNYNNKTYAVYGNPYVYPMEVVMKEEINYFQKEDKNFKYFTNIFKSNEQLQMRENLIDFNFGTTNFYNLTPNSQDNIISAEIEYKQNKQNHLYEFSSIGVKYSKAVEEELYRFLRDLFLYLIQKESHLGEFSYQVQGISFKLKDINKNKPNFGTYKYLLRQYDIKNAIHSYIEDKALKPFILFNIPTFITTMQNIRNESVHGDTTSLSECETIRKEVIGIGQSGILNELLRYKNSF
jgi:hypothetical protein